jgi:hypothetical protein
MTSQTTEDDDHEDGASTDPLSTSLGLRMASNRSKRPADLDVPM